MKVAELIRRLEPFDGDLEVSVNIERIGVLPLVNVKLVAVGSAIPQPDGSFFVDGDRARRECELVACPPRWWRLQHHEAAS